MSLPVPVILFIYVAYKNQSLRNLPPQLSIIKLYRFYTMFPCMPAHCLIRGL